MNKTQMSEQENNISDMPDEALIRLETIVGNKKKGIKPLLPISRTAWFYGIRDGIYPQGKRIGKRTTAWQVRDIRALINSFESV